MSEKVFKYPLEMTSDQMIEMPKGAAVLCVQAQGGLPKLWASVDPTAPRVKRRFGIYGTGHEMPGFLAHYVGTFQMQDGAFVFHVFTDRLEYPVDSPSPKAPSGGKAT
jgi:hypothetical protein